VSILIFCSFEVGGQPFRYAETLNRLGVPVYYISLASGARGHDSTAFHFGAPCYTWDLSKECAARSTAGVIASLRRVTRKYGINSCFATGGQAYLLAEAGLSYKYWCYGSDLDQMCFSPQLPTLANVAKRSTWTSLALHLMDGWKYRKSITQAKAVMVAPYQRASLNTISPGAARFFLPHLLAAPTFNDVWKIKTESQTILRRQYHAETLFFSSARHYWSGSKARNSDNKGNNKVLEAFARHLASSGRQTDKLVLISKGPDVKASRDMALRLGIVDSVIWEHEVPRERLFFLYAGATLCFGQFGTPVLTYAALEPLATGTPCISHFLADEHSRDDFYEALPPIWNCRDTSDTAQIMTNLSAADDQEYKQICFESWRWVNKHCSELAFMKSFIGEFDHSLKSTLPNGIPP